MVGQLLLAQSVGDYRSVANGNWSLLANWQRWNNPGGWLQPTGGQGYPGQNSTPGRVDINHDITLDVSPANPLMDLYINSGTLELSSYNLAVDGVTSIISTLSDLDPDGFVEFHGTVTVANSATWTSYGSPSAHLLFYGNIVNNSNNVSIDKGKGGCRYVVKREWVNDPGLFRI